MLRLFSFLFSNLLFYIARTEYLDTLLVHKMKIEDHCKTCFRKQAEAILKLCSADESVKLATNAWLEAMLTCLPNDVPPAYIGRMIQRRIENLTGVKDPYKKIKEETNLFALKLIDGFREEVNAFENPLIGALRLSAAGNIIDLGAKRNLTLDEARKAVEHALHTPLLGSNEEEAVKRIANAKNLLIIADNSGEIAFDRLLCEFLPKRPKVAVRAAEIINDAVLKDAQDVGLTEFADIINTGSDMPGAWLRACGTDFIETFNSADLIISKGQGNYEGMNTENFPGYFVLRVKCSLVAESTGFPIDANLLVNAGRR